MEDIDKSVSHIILSYKLSNQRSCSWEKGCVLVVSVIFIRQKHIEHCHTVESDGVRNLSMQRTYRISAILLL